MFNKAIVIGGSIAGKLAAKALSTSFKEVIIIEAGEKWDGKVSRKRVPQSNHPHVLLKGGGNAIEKLFPNITNELIEAGSIVNNFTRDLKWHQFSGKVFQLLLWKLTNCSCFYKGDKNLIKYLHSNFIKRPLILYKLLGK